MVNSLAYPLGMKGPVKVMNYFNVKSYFGKMMFFFFLLESFYEGITFEEISTTVEGRAWYF